MSKKFKTKHTKGNVLKKILIFISLILLIIFLTFNKLYDFLINRINESDVINIFLNNKENDFKKIFSTDKINFLVSYTLGIDLNNKKEENEIKELTTIKTENENINNEEPIIYIYNTHQTEEYRRINTNDYNINPTVLHASYIFQNKLSDLGIKSIVEENNIKEILNINGWNYRNSYKASKLLATDALSKNPSIKYVIDLHRDSIPESIGKITIDNKDYAKIMFVLGKGHAGYERNLEMATRLNNYLKEFNESITRGINIKNNSGIFNQDLSPNAVLIEIGGPYNDINSVSNSLELLAKIYKRIVDEDNEKEET